MSILVTGGCGFIGSNFINYMTKKYPHTIFINLDKLDYCARESNVEDCGNYLFIKGDILDGYLVLKILNQYDVQCVIHFAAYSHVDNSFDNSIEFTKNNVLGTHQLLESCRIWGRLKKFIHVSTDEVYGPTGTGENSKSTGVDETSLLLPTNPYAASKAAAEMFVQSYRKSYGLPVIITRSNNIYGPRQYHEKVIPKFIVQNLTGKSYTIQNSQVSRSFLYVDDVVRAFDLILKNGVVGEIYNIGTEESIQIYDLCTKINLSTGKDNSYITIPDRLFNDIRYDIDCSKIMSLGWRPEISFRDGLARTIEWIKKNVVNPDYLLEPDPFFR